MHVLMSTDTVGGVWTYALELARAMAEHGVQYSLATMGARLTPDQRRDADRLANVLIYESEYRLEWMDDPWDDLSAAGDWLQDIARDVSPDLVHLNHYAHGASDWSAPCLVVGHSCVLSWHQCVRGEPAGPEWNRYRDLVTTGLRGADLVAAPTQAMLDMLDHFYGPLPDARAILNGRRSDFGLPLDKEPFVLTAGRVWDDAKNIAAVTAVAPRLQWPVRVAGLPHPSADHNDASEQSAADDRERPLSFLGRVTSQQMAEFYSRATIYALPARYEPFGLTPLEAALAGCALVLGDISTLREVWGDAAVFVPPEDHDALADAINGLISDVQRRAEFVQRAGARARELNERQMAAGYLRAYRELIRQPSPATAAMN